MELLKTAKEQKSEEEGEEIHEKAMEKALGDKMGTNDFDVMVWSAAVLLRDGQRLPEKLAEFAADVLEGKRSRPTKPGPDPGRDYHRNIALSFTTRVVAKKFGIARYANGNTNSETAVDAVSIASECPKDTVRTALKSYPLDPLVCAIAAARLGAKLDR